MMASNDQEHIQDSVEKNQQQNKMSLLNIIITVLAFLVGIFILGFYLFVQWFNSLPSSGMWICGRVFRIGGKPFLPPVNCIIQDRSVSNKDYYSWASQSSRSLCELAAFRGSAAEQQLLEMAREEYASVATFSRLNLELMALGAPAELILQSTKAITEEIHHARFMFGVYSAVSGERTYPVKTIKFIKARSSILARWGWRAKFSALVKDALIDGVWNEGLNALYLKTMLKYSRPEIPHTGFIRLVEEETQHHEFAKAVCRWATTQQSCSIHALDRDLQKVIAKNNVWPKLEAFIEPHLIKQFAEELSTAKDKFVTDINLFVIELADLNAKPKSLSINLIQKISEQ